MLTVFGFHSVNAQTNYIAPTTTETFVAGSSFWTAPTMNVENTAIDVIEDPNHPNDFVAVRAWDGDKPGLQIEISALGYSESYSLNSFNGEVIDPDLSIIPSSTNSDSVYLFIVYEVENAGGHNIYYRIGAKDITNSSPLTTYQSETLLESSTTDLIKPQIDYTIKGESGAIAYLVDGTSPEIRGCRLTGLNNLSMLQDIYVASGAPCNNTTVIRGFDVAISDKENNTTPAEYQVMLAITGEDASGNVGLSIGNFDFLAFAANPVTTCSVFSIVHSFSNPSDTILQNCRIAAPDSANSSASDALDCSIVYEGVDTATSKHIIFASTRDNGSFDTRIMNDINSLYDCFNEKPVVTYVKDNIITAWQSKYDASCQVSPTSLKPFLDSLDIVVRQCNYSGTPLNSFYSVANDNFDGNQIIPSLTGRNMSNAGTNTSTFYFWFDDNSDDLAYKNRFYSSTSLKTSVQEIEKGWITAYPNPVEDILNLKSELKITKIEVIDIQGRTILNQENQLNTIDFSHFPKGVYFVKVSSEQSQNKLFKIVK